MYIGVSSLREARSGCTSIDVSSVYDVLLDVTSSYSV